MRYGTETISYPGRNIGTFNQKNIKKLIHYIFSKEKLQIGKQMNALVDTTYIQHLGFI